MRKNSVLKPFAVAAGMAVLAFPTFAHSEGGGDRAGSYQAPVASRPVEPAPRQLPGSGEMETTDRSGTTGPSGSEAFSTDTGAVDAIERVAKPAGDYAATGTDRGLAALIRVTVAGDPAIAPLLNDSFHIAVDNGTVTLQGEVRDERAKEQINAKVIAMTGSHPVENKLVVARR
jgi:BON domain